MLILGGGHLLLGGLIATMLGLTLFRITSNNTAAPPQPQTPPPTRVPPLWPPVQARVIRPFDMTRGEFKHGHRGIDLAARPGTVVTAPAPGLVRFAGRVARLGWVTIEVQPNVLVSVGPLEHISVHAGDVVGVLTPLGTVQPGHNDSVHLGVRVDGLYVDPLPYLANMGTLHLALLSNGAAAGVSPPRRGWRSRFARLPKHACQTIHQI